jgi:hypothetical protein
MTTSALLKIETEEGIEWYKRIYEAIPKNYVNVNNIIK